MLACADIEDSDQPVHLSSMVALWVSRGLAFLWQKTKADQTVRMPTDLNLCCMHMPTCTLCLIPVQMISSVTNSHTELQGV